MKLSFFISYQTIINFQSEAIFTKGCM